MNVPVPDLCRPMVIGVLLAGIAAGQVAAGAPTTGPSAAEAIAEVAAGKRATADASWWGFDEQDATEAIQSAIDSPAHRVLVPFMGRPWIVRPLRLRSDLELELAPGVVLLAKEGEFRGRGDSLLLLQNVSRVTVRGYGAVLRMRKRDYQNPPYDKAEWRMGIRTYGCRQIRIEGLRIESSGGDGIYIDGGPSQPPEDFVVRDCVCHDNHRQGMSVICARNLLVENCVFSRTDGTPPEAGIDFEPDSKEQFFVNCLVRNCVFQQNSGHAILVYLKPMTGESEPVSIRFENCVSRMIAPGRVPPDRDSGGWSGMCVGAVRDDGPGGTIEFVNCNVESSGREGAKVFDKSARSAAVRFVNCRFGGSWLARAADFGGPRVPILFELRRPSLTRAPGGVELIDCHVFDQVSRPAVAYYQRDSYLDLDDVRGQVTVHSPHPPRIRVGETPQDVELEVRHAVP